MTLKCILAERKTCLNTFLESLFLIAHHRGGYGDSLTHVTLYLSRGCIAVPGVFLHCRNGLTSGSFGFLVKQPYPFVFLQQLSYSL